MRIAWFTPFVDVSAIGENFSRFVVDELAREHHVDVWVSDKGELCPTSAHIVRYDRADSVDMDALRNYDVVAYNIGDNYTFHREIFTVAKRFPGIIVLHDYVLHNFVPAYFNMALNSKMDYLAALDKHYGERGRRLANRILAGESIISSDETWEYPLFEEVIANAFGIVVHSDFMFERVNSVFPGPVRKIFLAHQRVPARPKFSRSELGLRASALTVVSVGYLNRNRRLEAVLEALAEDRQELPKFHYYIIGPATDREYEEALKKRIHELNLGDVVSMLGYQDRARLDSYLHYADLCINLRFPPTEGASASTCEQMLHGKPIIVTDVGFYQELPDTAVAKVKPNHETRDLRMFIKRLMNDPALRQKMGSAGKEFALEKTSSLRYANEFASFCDEVRDIRPIMEFELRVASHLAMMKVDDTMSLAECVASEAYHLFVGNDR